MTHQDEILEMAKKAGMIWMSGLNGSGYHINHPKTIEAFAKLVASAAASKEREACAKIVENEAYQYASPVWAFEIVNAIRDRGNKA